jgi:hypothetical protein
MRGKRVLRLDRGCDRIARARKNEKERVALRVDLAAAVPAKYASKQPLMLGEDLAVTLPELALEPRRALDVREQERNRTARQVRETRVTRIVHIQPATIVRRSEPD